MATAVPAQRPPRLGPGGDGSGGGPVARRQTARSRLLPRQLDDGARRRLRDRSDVGRAHEHRALHVQALHRRRSDPHGLADLRAADVPGRASAASTTGSTGPPGARPAPRTTPGHGAYSWKDYFRINTDHKVIGVQYTVTLVLLPARRRTDRDADARRARRAGRAVRRRQHLQRAVLGARLAADLPVRDPRVRGPGQLRHPADDRRARHGLPAAERAVLLAAADRRRDDARQLLRARRSLRRRLDGLRAAVDQCADRSDVLLARRAVRRRVFDHDRAELPRDDHHHARARG